MSNPSKLTPRRHPSASAPQPIEYDGADAPVLIRLPDLSAAPAAPAAPTGPSDALQSTDRQSASRKGRRRRIDRSHSTSRRQRDLPAVSLDAIPKSRFVIAALVVAVAGITYSLLPSNQNPEEDSSRVADPWAEETPLNDKFTDVQVVMPNNSNVDLWPEKSEAAGQQGPYSISPPLSLHPEQSIAQDRQTDQQSPSQDWPNTPRGVPFAAPSGHSAPVQSDGFDEIAPALSEVPTGVRARRVSNQSSPQGWPEDSSSTSDAPAVPAQTAYPRGPSHGARLDGISFPHPTNRDEPRTKMR